MKKLSLLVLGFMTIMSFNSYACKWDSYVEAIDTRHEIQKDDEISEKDGTVFVHGMSHEGWMVGLNNNYYYNPKGSFQYIKDKKINGMYMNSSGEWQNPSMVNSDKNKELSTKYENGEQLEFETAQEYIDWAEYYVRNYNLYDENLPVILENLGPGENGKHTVKVERSKKRLKRDIIKQKIIDKYGHLEGCDWRTATLDGFHKILDNSTYTKESTRINMIDAMNSNKYVCWHYARLLKTLLEDAGYNPEILICWSYGDFHSLLRLQTEDGKWHYIDPTFASGKEPLYYTDYIDISIGNLLWDYTPVRSVFDSTSENRTWISQYMLNPVNIEKIS